MKTYFTLLLFFSFYAFGQPNGVTLLDHKNIPHGQSGQGTYYSSCWGWVSPTGEEYAFLGNYDGMSIYSMVGDSLHEIQFIPGPHAGYAYREMKTYKHYLYIVSEGNVGGQANGVQIVDLSQLPDTAVLVKNFNYTSGNKNILRSHTVTLADGYLYLNGSANWSPGGMVIFDLHNDPTTPVYVGQYEPEYIHDSYVRNDTIFAAAIYSNGGLYVANAHNKANPTLIKKVTYSGSGTHHCWETIDNNYALTTDEIGTINELRIFNFKNLGAGPPYTPAAEWRANATDLTHNVHGRGNYAYVSHYAAGARVVDIHNPLSPVEAGYYDTDSNSVAGYEGCWAVYPYFFSGRWIASDMTRGLYLMNFTGLKPRTRPSLLSPLMNDSVGNSSVTFSWTSAADKAEDPHWYELHIEGSNVNKVIKSVDTAISVSDFSGLVHGQTYTWYVNVVDEFTEVLSTDSSKFIYNGVSTNVIESLIVPEVVSLSQNYPNPFNPSTKFEFSLPKEEFVSLKIYNLAGEELTSLIDGIQPRGKYEMAWDASNYPSGIYLYRLTVGTTTETKKMILTK